MHPNFKLSVMGPLNQITDWVLFEQQLHALKACGIASVSIDIWWASVERSRRSYTGWPYFRNLTRHILRAGLLVAPILSTHAVPTYLEGDANMWNTTETGEVCHEALSPWFDGHDEDGALNASSGGAGTVTLYAQFFESFEREYFAYFARHIDRVYLSGGASGEIRHCSIDGPIYGGFPKRGAFMCYSRNARAHFTDRMKMQYDGSLARLNKAWGTMHANWTDVQPPEFSRMDAFLRSAPSANDNAYAHDFLNWYQDTLLELLQHMARDLHRVLLPHNHNHNQHQMPVPLCAKIAGFGWLYFSPDTPRAVELCAGYYDYHKFARAFQTARLDLTFTAIEKENDNCERWHYAGGRDLSLSIIAAVRDTNRAHQSDYQVQVRGENADSARWFQDYHLSTMCEMLFCHNLAGITIMRYNDLFERDVTVDDDTPSARTRKADADSESKKNTKKGKGQGKIKTLTHLLVHSVSGLLERYLSSSRKRNPGSKTVRGGGGGCGDNSPVIIKRSLSGPQTNHGASEEDEDDSSYTARPNAIMTLIATHLNKRGADVHFRVRGANTVPGELIFVTGGDTTGARVPLWELGNWNVAKYGTRLEYDMATGDWVGKARLALGVEYHWKPVKVYVDDKDVNTQVHVIEWGTDETRTRVHVSAPSVRTETIWEGKVFSP